MNARTPSIFGSALLAAAAVTVAPVFAQTTTNSGTTAAEVQRGVPGTDVDLNANGRSATNGVPGVDMDVGNPRRNNGVPGVDVDTRSAGAGPVRNSSDGQRAARADRN